MWRTSRLDCAKQKKRVGCDGFHPNVPLDLTEETRKEIVEFLEKVEQSGTSPQQECTTMFFLVPKNVASERPIALMPTLTRWWEAVRAPEVAKWQQKYRVEWDATDGRNGGAQRTVWKYCWKWRDPMEEQKKRIKVAVALVSGPSEGLRACQLPCGLGLGDALLLPKEDLASAVRIL